MALSEKDQEIHDYVFKELNLDYVRDLVDEHNRDWSRDQLTAAEAWYRNFLWLSYRIGRTDQIVGIEPHADQFWHAHILDTEDYAKACARILGNGGFVHHKPPKGAKEINERVRAESQEAYEKYRDELELHTSTRSSIGPFDIPCFWHIIFG